MRILVGDLNAKVERERERERALSYRQFGMRVYIRIVMIMLLDY